MTPTQPPERTGRVLDVDPDLGADLDQASLEEARRLLRAPSVTLAPGVWDQQELRAVAGVRGRAFGGLIASGLLIREDLLAGRAATTLYGPRDLIGIDEGDGVSLPIRSRYVVATLSTVLVLDDRLLAGARRWPRLVARLAEALAGQTARGCAHRAVSQLPRVEDRLVALFWHLADQWGHVGPEGVQIDLPLTHEALGRLVGARRPTVSLGLQRLAEQALLTRHENGGWQLAPRSIELLASDERSAARLRTLVTDGRRSRSRPAAVARLRGPDRDQIAARLDALRAQHHRNAERTAATLARAEAVRHDVTRRRERFSLPGGAE